MFYTTVQCDKCGRVDVIAYACGVCTARSLARKKGWSVGRKKDEYRDHTFCPECKRGAKKNAK